MKLKLAAVLAAFSGLPAFADEGAPRFSLPVACEPHRDCFVQNYVDVEAGPEVRDFACGAATYEGHDGIDFRIGSAAVAARGVDVRAAAAGTVKGMRDGMADTFPREGGAGDAGKAAVKGRECGNGVVVDHGNGWETQYCHMRRGSVRVSTGDKVSAGQALGSVGFSGLADFAHLHFTVRHNGQALDPFTGHGRDGACLRDPAAAQGLWEAATAKQLGYVAGEIVTAAFSGRIVTWPELEHDEARIVPPTRDSDQIVFVVRLINLRAGDRIRIEVTGPGGFSAVSPGDPLDRAKAIYLAYAGKKRTQPQWPAGRYEARVQVLRGEQVVAERKGSVALGE